MINVSAVITVVAAVNFAAKKVDAEGKGVAVINVDGAGKGVAAIKVDATGEALAAINSLICAGFQ